MHDGDEAFSDESASECSTDSDDASIVKNIHVAAPHISKGGYPTQGATGLVSKGGYPPKGVAVEPDILAPEKPSLYKKGDGVRVRDYGNMPWQEGVVTSVDPLEVRPDGWPRGVPFKQVEKVSEAASPATPPRAPGRPLRSPASAKPPREQHGGDEVWQNSDSEASSAEVVTPRGDDSATPSPPRPAPSPQKATKELLEATTMIAAPLPEVRVRTSVATKRPGAKAAPPALQTSSNGQQRGLMGLLTHLRGDNERLRDALVGAQREAERMAADAAERGSEAPEAVDFGHLLALVKEFGDDGLGGADAEQDWWGEDEPEDEDPNVRRISMCTPRAVGGMDLDDDPEDADAEAEVSKLREELEASRLEALQLRNELEAKDAELNEMRTISPTTVRSDDQLLESLIGAHPAAF